MIVPEHSKQFHNTDTIPPKPPALALQPDYIPAELQALRQWVTWKYEYQPERSPQKPWTKPPFQVNGKYAKSTDPSTWTSFEEALLHLGNFDGIGFAPTKEDPYALIDLDHCRDPHTGRITAWAQKIIQQVMSYTEVSPTGTGIRIIAKGTLPPEGRKKGDIEIYNTGHYLTLTGHHLEGTPLKIHERQSEIQVIHTDVFGPQSQPHSNQNGKGPSGWASPQLSDGEILDRAFSAKNGVKIRQLYLLGDTSGYNSRSEADLGLCDLLVFYTGTDLAQLDRLFRGSKLFRPEKWDKKHHSDGRTYGQGTLDKALARTTEFYSPNGKGASAHDKRERDQSEPLDSDPDTDEVRVHITALQDVALEQIKPLWPKRIFLGKLAVMAGDPGLGKSYASLDIAARVSLGGPWPDGSGNAPKGNVLLLSAEDGLADTVKPRLELLGADMGRIYALGLTVAKSDGEVGLSLQEHLLQIEQEIVQKEVILLVVDPLLAFTGRVDTHKTAEVRGLLSPLAAMAERTGCAILGVMHPNKNSHEGNLLYRISASLDFAAAARSVMVVARHPDNPDQRVMATVKCNLSAPPEPMSFGFTLDGCFAWQGVTEVDISQLMGPVDREDASALDEAKQFLREVLADGDMPAKDVLAEAREWGIHEKTLRRAVKDLEIDVARLGEAGKKGGGKWVWRLPLATRD